MNGSSGSRLYSVILRVHTNPSTIYLSISHYNPIPIEPFVDIFWKGGKHIHFYKGGWVQKNRNPLTGSKSSCGMLGFNFLKTPATAGNGFFSLEFCYHFS